MSKLEEYFTEPVAYLEDEDFDKDGKCLVDTEKPIIILVQGSFCGYCKQMKPSFQKVVDAAKDRIMFCTIEIDGNDSEQKLGRRLGSFFPMKGVPMIVMYKNGKFVQDYKGDRSEKSLMEFAGVA